MFNVPDVMLLAFVVSIVAEEASPVTDPEAITIFVFVALVTRPLVSTVKTGTTLALP